MNEIEDRRLRELLHEIADGTPVRDPRLTVLPAATPVRALVHEQPRRRGSLVAVAALAVVVVGAVVFVASGRDDDVRTIDSVVDATTAPNPTVTASSPTTKSAPTTAAPAVETSSVQATGALSDVGEQGGPIGLRSIPEGFHLERGQQDRGGAFAGSSDVAWYSTYLEIINGQYTGRQFGVQIYNILPGDDPYSPTPGVAPEPVTYGAYTGRVQGGSEDATFATALDDQRLLTVIGHIGVDMLQPIVEGLVPRSDEVGFDLTGLDQFVKVADNPGGMVPINDGSWTVVYLRDNDPNVGFTIATELHPIASADARLTYDSAQQIEVLGQRATLVNGAVYIDVRAGVTVGISGVIDPIQTGPVASNPVDPIAIAEQLGSFTDDEWSQVLNITAQAPPVTYTFPESITGPCAAGPFGYSAITDDNGDELDSFNTSEWSVAPGDGVHVSLALRPGVTLGPVTARLISANGSAVELTVAEEATTYTDVIIRWDGTINGAAAPPGRYRITIDASIAADEANCPETSTEVPLSGAYVVR